MRDLPRGPARRGAGHGLGRAREGARDHDPRQEHRRPLQGRPRQHRGHAGPQGLRLRGRADPDDGRGGAPARGRLGGPAAPDPLRVEEGARGQQAPDRPHQQDRPRRRADAGSRAGDPGPLPLARDPRGAPGVPDPLRLGPHRFRLARPERHIRRPETAPRHDPRAHPASGHRGEPLQDDCREHRLLGLLRPARDRPRPLRQPGQGRGARGRARRRHDRREGEDGEDLHVRGDRARGGDRRLGRRHLHDLRLSRDRDRRHDPRPRRPDPAARHPHRRADALHGVPRQRLADVRPVGKVRHEPASARTAGEGARQKRRASDAEDPGAGLLRGAGAGRALARDPGGDDAARGLRVRARPPAGHPAAGRERRAAGALRSW